MNFTQKVTARNIFRYKQRMFMTIFGVCGSIALLFAGLGIRTTQLNTKDVISLLFSVYNPLLDSTQAQREEK